MFEYIINGQVRPQTELFSNISTEFDLKDPDLGFEFKVDLVIINSKITVKITSKDEIHDDETLRNFVRDFIKLQTDLQGYINGHYYDVEIDYIYNVTNNERVVFSTNIDEISSDSSKRAIKTPDEIFHLFAELKYSFLRVALADLGYAIKYPRDTGFFCYRALESLRKFFNESDASKGWELLRKNLNVLRNFIDVVKKFADEPRHGGLVFMTGPDRIKAMQNTWQIVDRFIEYAKNNNNPLDITRFPEL